MAELPAGSDVDHSDDQRNVNLDDAQACQQFYLATGQCSREGLGDLPRHGDVELVEHLR